MTSMLRLSLLTAALIVPSLAFAADPPSASQPGDQRTAVSAAQQPAAATGSMSWPSAPPAIPAPTTHPTPGNIPPPPAGKGQVVFYRKKLFKGAAISFMVRENGKELGKLGSGDYFVATLDPGPHDFYVHSENHETLHMDIEAGATYYVSGFVTMGVLLGRAHIEQAESLSFGMVFNDLSLSR